MRQQQISRRSYRLFYYDSARASTLSCATMRNTQPGAATYSPLNSIVYTGIAMNSLWHDRGCT